MKGYIFINRIVSFLLLAVFFIFMLIIAFLIKLTFSGKVIFVQKRLGHNKKSFNIYKFRTMVENADELKRKYIKMNEVDGPVFKIENDPRFTRIGKFLSRTHLDELPQLLNVLNGDMLLVGFRPPTLDEVRKYKSWQMKRFEGYPGITSFWAVNGGHKKFSFDEWIKSDIDYEKKRSFYEDLKILFKTLNGLIESLL